MVFNAWCSGWFSGSRPLARVRHPALLPGFLLALALLTSGACKPARTPPPAAPPTIRPANTAAPPTPPAVGATPATSPAPARLPGERVMSLVVTTRMRNNLEACGCTSEPLGDVARLAALVKGQGALLLDAGGLRYDSAVIPAEKLPQLRKKADFLENTWSELGAATMLQPEDLRGQSDGAEVAGRRRVASNVSGLPPGCVVGEAVRKVGGLAIGVLGLADPGVAWPPGVQVSDPIAAAQAGVQRLRAQGVQAIVALTGLPREAARRLARKVPGLQLIVAGNDRELVDGVDLPESVGETLLVVPGQKGERVVRVELHVPAGGRPAWTVYPSHHQQELILGQQRSKLQAAQARLAGLRADPTADPAFIATTAAEVQSLQAQLSADKAAPPRSGYVVAELLPITRSLPRDPEMAAAMTALDRRIGEDNLAATAGPPPPPPPGQPRYIGNAGCLGGCHYHSDAVEFWQTTHHAGAWKTLVDGGKELSYDCVGCHTVGFDAEGGSNLWTLTQWQRGTARAPAAGPDLRNNQCEACHGPGSLHARAPSKIAMPVRQPGEDRCLDCHTKEHSDTFAFVPYLRDILGPGHGEERRKTLGSGPTGHELRSAALRAHAAPNASPNASH